MKINVGKSSMQRSEEKLAEYNHVPKLGLPFTSIATVAEQVAEARERDQFLFMTYEAERQWRDGPKECSLKF